MRPPIAIAMLWACLLGVVGAAVRAAPAEEDPEIQSGRWVTPEAQQAIDKGLAFLATRQQDEGSFGVGGYSRNVAVAALSGMAFMSAGNMPGRGPYGAKVDKCVDFVLDHTEDSGFINVEGATTHGPMYGHGFATLFLAEAYGMTRRPDMRQNWPRRST